MARISVVGIVLVICLSTLIFSDTDFSPNKNAVAEEDGADGYQYPWTMFRGNLNNSGYSTSTVPTTNKTFFEFPTGFEIWSSPIYYDFKIYFGTGRHDESAPRKIYSLEVATGSEVWSNITGGPIIATPLIVNDTLYIGSMDGKLYAYNATTGEQLWNFTTGDGIASSAKFYNGSIFFGSWDGKIYAVNATDGTEVWNFTTGGEIWSTPAISNESIFFGSHDNNMYCLWVNNGTKKWNNTIGTVYSSPTVYNGKVFAGTEDFTFVSLDEYTGELKWTFDINGYVYSSPAVNNGNVYFGMVSWADSLIYVLPEDDPSPGDGFIDETEIIWSNKTYDNLEGGSSPVISGGNVLIGTNGGDKLYCFNETTGEEVWNLAIDNGIVSTPLVVDGKVFIGSRNGVMYAIGSSGLPLLDIEISPESLTIKGGRTMKISFLVTHNNQPVQGAFINVRVTNGTLTQSGFSTFSDGTQKVKYMAAALDENRTITISAEATKYGFEEGISSVDIMVEPAERYDVETSEDWLAILAKYSIYLIAIIVLVVINLLIFILVRKKRKIGTGKEGE